MLTGAAEQNANPWQLCRTGLLRTSSERPSRRAAEKCDELTPPHATPPIYADARVSDVAHRH